MDFGEEVSAFSIYKKRPTKQVKTRATRALSKGHIKKQFLKSSHQQKTTNSVYSADSVMSSRRKRKANRKRKQTAAKGEPSTQRPSKKTAKAAAGSAKIRTNSQSATSLQGKSDKVVNKPKSNETGSESPKSPQEKVTHSSSHRVIEGEPESTRSPLEKVAHTSPPRVGEEESPATDPSHSLREALNILHWLIAPNCFQTFYEDYWEEKPYYVARNDPTYFSKLISFQMLDKMLVENHIEFNKNVTVTVYKNGKRKTRNVVGRALPPELWSFYASGHSVRFLNPQTYLPGIYTLNTTLQEYFHSMVGCNAYLTPAKSQGFAPHYDDIEAFILQIEGRKRWKLYKPRSESDVLPRVSSADFSQDEIGEPIFEKVLMPGDVLYFPRGTIHQAFTEPGFHSLHITLSVYQKQSFVDLLEILLPLALERASNKYVELRRGVPFHIWSNFGVAYADIDSENREDLIKAIRYMLSKTFMEIPLDDAVDQFSKKYYREALPPEIKSDEKLRTVFGGKSYLSYVNSSEGRARDYDITLNSRVRLLRANIVRLVKEEECLGLFFYVDNTREYSDDGPNYMQFELGDFSSLKLLIRSYPNYVTVKDLPMEDTERKLELIDTLWGRGLLILDKPFK